MEELFTQGISSAEPLQLISIIQKENDRPYPDYMEIGVTPDIITKTATYGASLLLAYGSANLADRTYLIVKNKGRNLVLVGDQSSAAIYEEGIPVEPGETKVFKIGSTVSLYARSMGYGAEIEIVEI